MAPQAAPLHALTVVGVRYRGSRPAPGDERCLDTFRASGVYEQAGVPASIVEPAMPEAERRSDEPDNLGLIGGAIADAVAAARHSGHAVLMTGGDCSHITGVVGGLQDAHGANTRIGLVWFDAHGDFNTPNTTLSGMLGGMPVAVAAGLAYPFWREASHIVAPLPTNRIVMVDVRNLDAPEEQLMRATDVTIARVAPEFPGQDLEQAVARLADACDMIYLHIDSDILDERFVPNHGTREPGGPDMEQVRTAIDTVMATGKVVALAVVSVYGEGQGADVSRASGVDLIRHGLESWRQYGTLAT
ncbi:MAG TPA: arginase family protein [Roseiflexaceae bacterium]|nr:arginase family protein [Roseiflexaceae bacterium]